MLWRPTQETTRRCSRQGRPSLWPRPPRRRGRSLMAVSLMAVSLIAVSQAQNAERAKLALMDPAEAENCRRCPLPFPPAVSPGRFPSLSAAVGAAVPWPLHCLALGFPRFFHGRCTASPLPHHRHFRCLLTALPPPHHRLITALSSPYHCLLTALSPPYHFQLPF